jgi:hypothetical protein
MPKPKAPRRTELLDMGARALQEFEEHERRQYHERIRQELVQRGAIVEPPPSVQELLEEAAPNLERAGWRITRKREER